MKVASLGNMAADGLLTTEALRSVGVDAELIVNHNDFACAYPEWELADFGRNIEVNNLDGNIDPYAVSDAELKTDSWRRPPWIKTLHYKSMFPLKDIQIGTGLSHSQFGRQIRRLMQRVGYAFSVKSVLDAVKPYDLVEAHVPFPVQLQWGRKPYIVYEAGWIRSLTSSKYNQFESKVALRGYARASAVIYTNPDMWHIFRKHQIAEGHRIFMPFAIDTDRYKPVYADDVRAKLAPRGEFLVLGMARQNWRVKGSDVLIQGFARFHKQNMLSRLILMAWGDDLKRSRQLIHDLNLQDAVTWLPFMPKSKLILLYNAVDVACDQFRIGCWGTSYPEAMACGRPTLIYYNPEDIVRAFGSLPPIPSVSNEIALSLALSHFYRRGAFQDSGECREWIKATHDMQLIGEKHKQICEEVMSHA